MQWTRRFWRIFLPSMVAGLAAAALGWSPTGIGRPDFPVPGRAFVAEYSRVRSSLAHNIYYRGLFGFGERIRESSIVLLGSSHMELGVSAERVTELTGANAFNLALGCGESAGFGLEILRRVRSNAKLVVADTFHLASGLTPCSREAEANDVFQAYATVAGAWTEFAFDWLADSFLPRFALRDGRLEKGRYLSGLVVINDWQRGGAVEVWHPVQGVVFGPGATGSPDQALTALPETAGAFLPVSAELSRRAGALAARIVATLVPYSPGPDERDRFLGELQAASGPGAWPFVKIDADGLRTYDGQHLTYPSSRTATERLFLSLQAGPDPAFTRR